MNLAQEKVTFKAIAGKLVFMLTLSILLCFSGFLTVFTPLPIGISSLQYGRNWGMILAGIASFLFMMMVAKLNAGTGVTDFSFAYFFMGCMVVALTLSELIRREYDPVKGVVTLGALMIAVLGVMLTLSLQVKNLTLNEYVLEHVHHFTETVSLSLEEMKKTNLENAHELEALVKQPQKIADQIITVGPGLIIIGVYIIMWANMYLMLLFQRALNPSLSFRYSEKTLLAFKVPERVIFGVIAGLIFVLVGDHIGEGFVEFGYFLLMVLAVFYFFHGIGIYLEFLDFMRITGFLRSVLVVLTLLTAYQILALIGVFDMFVNFRKFFKRKNEND